MAKQDFDLRLNTLYYIYYKKTTKEIAPDKTGHKWETTILLSDFGFKGIRRLSCNTSSYHDIGSTK